MCQTRISCGVLCEASGSSRTEVLEDTPFHLRFRFAGVVLLARRFDMAEVRERKQRVTSATPTDLSAPRGWKLYIIKMVGILRVKKVMGRTNAPAERMVNHYDRLYHQLNIPT